MKLYPVLLALVFAPAYAAAQSKPVPVEERAVGKPVAPVVQQQRTSAAYRAMTQAAHETKLAEQEYVNTQDAHAAAQKRADALKADLEKAAKARDAAKAKEAAARTAYEEELKRQ